MKTIITFFILTLAQLPSIAADRNVIYDNVTIRKGIVVAGGAVVSGIAGGGAADPLNVTNLNAKRISGNGSGITNGSPSLATNSATASDGYVLVKSGTNLSLVPIVMLTNVINTIIASNLTYFGLTNLVGGGGGGGGSDPGAGAMWYKMDGSGGTITDSSANANTATLTGSPTRVTGKFSNALQFSGTGQYCVTPSISDYAGSSGDFAISIWVKFTTASGFMNVLQWNDGANGGTGPFFQRSGDHIVAGDFASTISTATLSDGAWHNVIISKASNVTTVYVDGSSIGTFADSVREPQLNTSNVFSFGANVIGSTPFDGAVDDIRFFKTSLTTGQVTWLQTNP